jgi:hypothetical protein
MKILRSIIVLLTVALSTSSFSQIYPGEGLIPADSCNFESTCTMVSIDTTIPGNIWRIGAPNKTPFTSSYTLPNAIVTNLDSSYPVGNDSWFDLKINIWNMGLPNPVITFRHKYKTDTLSDGGYVEISYDKGITWRNVLYDTSIVWMSYDNNTPNREGFYTPTDTIEGGIPAFSGTSNGWQYSRIQWLWFIPVKDENDTPGDSIFIRFHFKSDSIDNNKAGWMIDNIVIYNTLISDIPEYNAKNGIINIYPNPATNNIYFALPENKSPDKIMVYDMTGRCIYSAKNASNELSVSGWPKGGYTVMIKCDDAELYRGFFMKE